VASRGSIWVKPLTANDYMARQRVGYELRSKVVEAIDTFMANKRA
jgi:hypothetical protein